MCEATSIVGRFKNDIIDIWITMSKFNLFLLMLVIVYIVHKLFVRFNCAIIPLYDSVMHKNKENTR